MHLDADDLLARLRQEWPTEYELTHRQLVIEALTAENERLNHENEQLRQTPAPPGIARPYGDEARHG